MFAEVVWLVSLSIKYIRREENANWWIGGALLKTFNNVLLTESHLICSRYVINALD